MNYALTHEDLESLSPEQEGALVHALFLAMSIDREITADERKVFQEQVGLIPWRLSAAQLREEIERARQRVKATTSREAWLAWLDELAAQVPPDLREKLLYAMTQIALVDGLNPSERGLLNVMITHFAVPADRVSELRRVLGIKD
jgi:hypothetical protein